MSQEEYNFGTGYFQEDISFWEKILKILKISLKSIGIILLILIIILIIILILNYFNLLSFSSLPPKYLSFLPHQKVEKAIPKTAKTNIQDLIQDLLDPSLIPSKINFEKQEVPNPNNYTFYGSGWQGENGEVFIPTIEYNQDGTLIDRQILIHVPKTINNLDASSSAMLARSYIKAIPPTSFLCTTLVPKESKSIFCEAFWKDNNGIKKGINVTSPVRGLNETQIFYCEHYKNSPAYLWKSCNFKFKDQGI